MIKYEVVGFDKLDEDICKDYGINRDYDWGEALFRVENGTRTLVYVDGGEPEDMTLSRNLGVLVNELNKTAQQVCG